MTEDQSSDQGFDPHRELVSMLLEKVQEDPYPSSTMMDFVEELLRPEEMPAYAAVLLDKIRNDTFPSLDLMTRVRDLA